MNETIHFLTHFLTQYVPFVLFMVVLVEQIGLSVPAIPFLIAAGILVGAGQMALGVAVGLAVLAALLGDQFWYKLGRQPGRREIQPGSGTVVPPLVGIGGLRMPQYLLYNGVGTILWVGSGVGLGYAFSDRLEEAVSVVAHLGSTTALILLGIVAGYIIYKALQHSRVGRLVSKLTVQHITEKVSAGKDPAVIDLRPHGARQDVPSIPGSLALSVVSRPDTRSTVKRERT